MNSTMQTPVLLIDSREAAKALGISARKLWGLTASGEIPHMKIGRLVRYRPNALKEWIESQEKRGRPNDPVME
jgi:excisionase family DNA binding protein